MGGRPKGSRNKLGEAFLNDAYETWKTRGKRCLEEMAESDPGGFCRLIGNILPDQFEMDVNVGVQIVRLPSHLDPAALEGLCNPVPVHSKLIEHSSAKE